MKSSSDNKKVRFRLTLFRKYFLALLTTSTLLLLASGVGDAWFGYREQRTMIDSRLKVEASAAAARISNYLDGIVAQMRWTVQLPWSADDPEAHHLDGLRLMRQVPAVIDLMLVDGEGREQVRASRIGADVVGSGIDRRNDPAVAAAGKRGIWHGPVTLNRGSEPYIRLAVAGSRPSLGVAVADINLTLIWDLISSIRVGDTGLAFVIDSEARLVAHPTIDLVLKGVDAVTGTRVRGLRDELTASDNEPVVGSDFEGRSVIAAASPIAGTDWLVIAELPTAEAYKPIRNAVRRTALLMLAGAVLAIPIALLLARRMTGPIHLLGDGAARIGAGQFDHRIAIKTGDELEALADRFNRMAVDLALSQERSERIVWLKRFLSPQVADIVESSGDGTLLKARRSDVVVVFGDLRGFTEFSVQTEPEEVMGVIDAYYAAVGAIITRHDATLTHFSGDGLMVLLNAPLPCPDAPVPRAVRMASDMRDAMQTLIAGWRARGCNMGFGIGIAKGVATVGRVGFEGRHDYTAIGHVVNLASRLCASAQDGQILLDSETGACVATSVKLVPLGPRLLKGLAGQVSVFAVAPDPGAAKNRPDGKTVV